MPDVNILSKYGMLDGEQFPVDSPERGYGGPILTAQAKRLDDLLTQAQAAHKKIMNDGGLNGGGKFARWSDLFKRFRGKFIQEESNPRAKIEQDLKAARAGIPAGRIMPGELLDLNSAVFLQLDMANRVQLYRERFEAMAGRKKLELGVELGQLAEESKAITYKNGKKIVPPETREAMIALFAFQTVPRPVLKSFEGSIDLDGLLGTFREKSEPDSFSRVASIERVQQAFETNHGRALRALEKMYGASANAADEGVMNAQKAIRLS